MKDNPLKPVVIFAYIVVTFTILSLLPEYCGRKEDVVISETDNSENDENTEYNNIYNEQYGRCY